MPKSNNKQARSARRNSRRYQPYPKQFYSNAGPSQPGREVVPVLPGMSIKSLPMGFPPRMRGTIRYHDCVALAGGASTTTSYVVSANGVYDPDITGTGHQPLFFDPMMQIYNHYTVRGARIKVIANSTTGAIDGIRAGLMVSGDTSVSTDFRVNVENGQIQYACLESKQVFGSACDLAMSVDIARFQGVKDVLDDPDLRGASNANPAEQTYFHMLCWNPQSAAVPSMSFDFTIDYDVVYQEPRKAPLS